MWNDLAEGLLLALGLGVVMGLVGFVVDHTWRPRALTHLPEPPRRSSSAGPLAAGGAPRGSAPGEVMVRRAWVRRLDRRGSVDGRLVLTDTHLTFGVRWSSRLGHHGEGRAQQWWLALSEVARAEVVAPPRTAAVLVLQGGWYRLLQVTSTAGEVVVFRVRRAQDWATQVQGAASPAGSSAGTAQRAGPLSG